jgi:PAS domain S-box-containing protein
MKTAHPDSVPAPTVLKGDAIDRLNAEQWLAALVESSDDAILGKSLDGIIASWNAGATRIFGYEAEEAIGKPVSFLAWPGEEGGIEVFLEHLRRGERADHFEVARSRRSWSRNFTRHRFKTESCMETETFWPLPLRSRPCSAANRPISRCIPLLLSPSAAALTVGGPSQKSVVEAEPPAHCATFSYTLRSLKGELSLKPLTDP